MVKCYKRFLIKNQQIIGLVFTYWHLSYLLAESFYNYRLSNTTETITRRDLLDNTPASEGLEQYRIDISKSKRRGKSCRFRTIWNISI